MIICPKCGSPVAFKQGVKKETGKPWSGYFCQNQDCKHVEWGKPSTPATPNNPPIPSEPQNREMVLLEAIDAVNENINQLREFLKNKLG